MPRSHDLITTFLAGEVSRDGGLDLLRKIRPIALQLSRAELRSCRKTYREAAASPDGESGGLFSRSLDRAARELESAKARHAELRAFLADPQPGAFASPLARYFDLCYRWGNETELPAPWNARYEDHVQIGGKVVPIGSYGSYADSALASADRKIRERPQDLLRIEIAPGMSLGLLPDVESSFRDVMLLGPEDETLAVNAVYVARAVRENARGQGLGSAICALDMLILPCTRGRQIAMGYTVAGFPSRLGGVDLIRDIARAIGEEPGDAGPRPKVVDGVVVAGEQECEFEPARP